MSDRFRAGLWFFVGSFGVIGAFLLAKIIFDVNFEDVTDILGGLTGSPWALPVTIGLFVVLALIGAPQWALITATILAFGPLQGSLFSWLGTLVSAVLQFQMGRWAGAERLGRVSGGLLEKLSAAIRNNGFMTSLVVRLVPTGPFLFVNLACGASRMKSRAYTYGTALGILPKIAIIALVSQGLISGLSGSRLAIGFAAAAILAIVMVWLARRRLSPLTADISEK